METSTALLGAAVLRDNDLLAERHSTVPRAHSGMLLPFCLEVLKEAGLELRDLSAICVSTGPGSFTGLRIGCATAQGLSLGLGLKVVPVPTWAVLLYQARDKDHVILVQGKARGQTVGAFYGRVCNKEKRATDMGPGTCDEILLTNLGFSEIICPKPFSLDGLFREVVTASRERKIRNVWAVGDAAREFCAGVDFWFKSANLDWRVDFQPVREEMILPLPESVGILGMNLLAHGQYVDRQEVLPMYYRVSQAEARRNRDEGEKS